MLAMLFDLIRFPGYILSDYLSPAQTTAIDLSSFNLNLGDFGSARLVATLTPPGSSQEQSFITVTLSNVNGEDSLLSINCCLLVLNENGEQIFKACSIVNTVDLQINRTT